MADIGPAAMRWLRMLAEDQRGYWSHLDKQSDEYYRRTTIIHEAADELRGDTRKLPMCLCQFSQAGVRADTNPECPEHGDNQ